MKYSCNFNLDIAHVPTLQLHRPCTVSKYWLAQGVLVKTIALGCSDTVPCPSMKSRGVVAFRSWRDYNFYWDLKLGNHCLFHIPCPLCRGPPSPKKGILWTSSIYLFTYYRMYVVYFYLLPFLYEYIYLEFSFPLPSYFYVFVLMYCLSAHLGNCLIDCYLKEMLTHCSSVTPALIKSCVCLVNLFLFSLSIALFLLFFHCCWSLSFTPSSSNVFVWFCFSIYNFMYITEVNI